MVKRPTGSDGEPSSPNCEASAGVKARQPLNCETRMDKGFHAKSCVIYLWYVSVSCVTFSKSTWIGQPWQNCQASSSGTAF